MRLTQGHMVSWSWGKAWKNLDSSPESYFSRASHPTTCIELCCAKVESVIKDVESDSSFLWG